MKKNDAYENMTMTEVYAKLDETVEVINETEDMNVKKELVEECAKLCTKYNELSMLSVYGKCAKAEMPIVEFAKTYYYETIKTEDNLVDDLDDDGRKKSVVLRSIVKSEKMLDLLDFLEWAEKANKTVTAQKAWRSAIVDARNSIETEWKKFFNSTGETYKVKIGEIKGILQKMFDALVFVPAPSGLNAVIANGKTARYAWGFANTRQSGRKDGKIVINGRVLTSKQWSKLVMDILHMTVNGKDYVMDYTILYGDEKPADETPAEAPKAEAEKPATGDKFVSKSEKKDSDK